MGGLSRSHYSFFYYLSHYLFYLAFSRRKGPSRVYLLFILNSLLSHTRESGKSAGFFLFLPFERQSRAATIVSASSDEKVRDVRGRESRLIFHVSSFHIAAPHFPFLNQVPSFTLLDKGRRIPNFQKDARSHLSPYVGTGQAEIVFPLPRFEPTALSTR